MEVATTKSRGSFVRSLPKVPTTVLSMTVDVAFGRYLLCCVAAGTLPVPGTSAGFVGEVQVMSGGIPQCHSS